MKQTSYKIVKSEPKKVFETTINGQFVNSNDNPGNAGSYIKSINNSWPNGMYFDWAQGSSAPTSNTPGAFVRTATAIYPNGEREDVKILLKSNLVSHKLMLIVSLLKVDYLINRSS